MHAETILRGATAYTQDRRQPRAAALAIGGGRILASSPTDQLDDLEGPDTRVTDLPGKAVVPGFVDAHVHFGHFALARRRVSLDAAITLDQGLTMVRSAAQRLKNGEWLQGRGWDRNRWGRLPTREDLDVAAGAHPAALSSHDGHSLWLNSAALQACDIGVNTPDPEGGIIQRDEAGEPTGVLFENAQELVRRRIPEPSDAELLNALRDGLRVAAAFGLTGIHNLEDARTRLAFRVLEATDELRLRVYHGVQRGELARARERGLRTGAGAE